MYYGGWDGLHGSRTRGASVAVAKWRRDGFVSYANGGHQLGVITTKPLRFTGTALHLNADVKGTLKVEVLDASGAAVPGFTAADSVAITGDGIDRVATWRNGRTLADLAGQDIGLRFHLDDGHLYFYRFS
ncbi:hypothetical protein [Spongiactinospora sp. 9N601]|uniref:hypothetical protein n=1 Tax=Spongiactinospora sp. 9N601 TaxID=3375149 RepID=UPI00379322E0